MSNEKVLEKIEALKNFIKTIEPIAIAVSGGIDSMVLAFVAHRYFKNVKIFHAISPAVPIQGTERVKKYAKKENWDLKTVQPGEFEDDNYVSNPANRCYYCKDNLYKKMIKHINSMEGFTLVSGTNYDDLSDYRPGLNAASENSVIHPFVEAKINKSMIRKIARYFTLNDLSELPASPCLSSRIETGINIDKSLLPLVNETELYLDKLLKPKTVRCRMRKAGIFIELDEKTLEFLSTSKKSEIQSNIKKRFFHDYNYDIHFAKYKMGSAFIRE